MCSRHYQGSHDTLIFVPPVPEFLIGLTTFPIGAFGYENRLMYEFQQQHYFISNPCITIRSFHNHDSGIKTNQLPERVNTEGRTVYSRPSFHYLDSPTGVNRIISYFDLDVIFHLLKTRSEADLCPVPDDPDFQQLVNAFCFPGKPFLGDYPWNCTHLPCSLLDSDEVPLEMECVNRFFIYKCQRYRSLTSLLRDNGLHLRHEGRFALHPSFFDLLESRRTEKDIWIFSFTGESIVSHPQSGNPKFLSRFNWTRGYDSSLYHEQTMQFLAGDLANYTQNSKGDIENLPFEKKDLIMMIVSNCHDKSNFFF